MSCMNRLFIAIAVVQVIAILSWIIMTLSPIDMSKYQYRHSDHLATKSRNGNFSIQQRPIRIHIYNYIYPFLPKPSRLCRGCATDCYVTTGPDTYMDSTIVVFLAPRLSSHKPPKKYPGQVWIFFGQESPPHHITDFNQWKNLFNWTFTYRRDADILALYGGFEKIKAKDTGSQTVVNKTMLLKSPTAQIAWLVSNCATPGKRFQYVEKLKENRNLSIDIYGKCGKTSCPKSTETGCMNFLSQRYNFYLAFENCLCFDYITEKSFKLYSKTGHLVPIVRGIGEYHTMYLPPNSYINAHMYATIKDLAADVLRISKNESTYSSFFEWRKHYLNLPYNTVHFCDIGKRTRKKDWQIKYKRLYEDIDLWLKGVPSEPFCKTPTDLR